ncbi:hypothetical protein AOT83_10895 [Mycobacteroides sp. H001]|nr:hypothetical protein AOT86_04395 [Mycobacteroides sp. H072]KRQ38875.1 hypothetical protein AOT84_06835 [Mycobacteroides sp. H002]KRQ49199.1 hypothetical protein AOT85_16110 [Mycobacteroides sp. H054]KRQ70326.1 hypothetical protein AOT83_10895 [Mycobacteroides sp. H001]OHU33307.1 hypothetical protein BKG79_22110 [Mycobacteroides chelonae]
MNSPSVIDMTAPQIHPDLTDELARQRTIEHIVHTLQQLPDGWIVGFQRPGWNALSAGSGAVGPNGEWNFDVGYWVWGYGDLSGDEVFEAFVEVWDSWGWIESTESADSLTRAAYGHTPDGYHFDIQRGAHDGVGTSWTSPYFPAPESRYDGLMPSIITKDGPQSYDDPHRA